MRPAGPLPGKQQLAVCPYPVRSLGPYAVPDRGPLYLGNCLKPHARGPSVLALSSHYVKKKNKKTKTNSLFECPVFTVVKCYPVYCCTHIDDGLFLSLNM